MAPSSSNRTKEPSEAEVVFTRASVALAKSQRLIASWLPPKSEAEIAREKELGTNQDGDDEDKDLEEGRKKGSDLLGVGATLPASDNPSAGGIMRRKDASLDALRTQLLGRHATKRGAAPTTTNAALHIASTPRPPVNTNGRGAGGGGRGPPGSLGERAAARDGDVEDGDEDEGRSAMFSSSKRARKGLGSSKVSSANTSTNTNGDATDGVVPSGEIGDAENTNGDLADAEPETESTQKLSKPMKRKPMSYLDEQLAKKNAKKKKQASAKR